MKIRALRKNISVNSLNRKILGMLYLSLKISGALLTLWHTYSAVWPDCRVCQQCPRNFLQKKLAHLPPFSQIQSAPKALIFIVFNTYFVTFAPQLTHDSHLATVLPTCTLNLCLVHTRSRWKLPYSAVWGHIWSLKPNERWNEYCSLSNDSFQCLKHSYITTWQLTAISQSWPHKSQNLEN